MCVCVRESEDEGEGDGCKQGKQGIWSSDLVTGGVQLRNRELRPARREGGDVFRVCVGGERESRKGERQRVRRGRKR